jgi:glutathione S-transferase
LILVHHLDHSRSHRVLWLLEELGAEYEVRHYRRDPATMLAPASLRAVHPLGKSPVVTEGDATIAESGAILEYLLDRYGPGGLRPEPGTPERLRYTYWLHYAEGSAMPPLLLGLVLDRMGRPPVPALLRPLARRIAAGMRDGYVGPQVRLHLDHMEAELRRGAWFAGEAFSAADIQMSFPVEAAAARWGLGEGRPNLAAYLGRIRDRPAYRRALERGGPYEIGR